MFHQNTVAARIGSTIDASTFATTKRKKMETRNSTAAKQGQDATRGIRRRNVWQESDQNQRTRMRSGRCVVENAPKKRS